MEPANIDQPSPDWQCEVQCNDYTKPDPWEYCEGTDDIGEHYRNFNIHLCCRAIILKAMN